MESRLTSNEDRHPNTGAWAKGFSWVEMRAYRFSSQDDRQIFSGRSEGDSESEAILCRDCNHSVTDHKITEHGAIIETHLRNGQVVKRFTEDAGFDYRCRVCGRDCINYLT